MARSAQPGRNMSPRGRRAGDRGRWAWGTDVYRPWAVRGVTRCFAGGKPTLPSGGETRPAAVLHQAGDGATHVPFVRLRPEVARGSVGSAPLGRGLRVWPKGSRTTRYLRHAFGSSRAALPGEGWPSCNPAPPRPTGGSIARCLPFREREAPDVGRNEYLERRGFTDELDRRAPPKGRPALRVWRSRDPPWFRRLQGKSRRNVCAADRLQLLRRGREGWLEGDGSAPGQGGPPLPEFTVAAHVPTEDGTASSGRRRYDRTPATDGVSPIQGRGIARAPSWIRFCASPFVSPDFRVRRWRGRYNRPA